MNTTEESGGCGCGGGGCGGNCSCASGGECGSGCCGSALPAESKNPLEVEITDGEAMFLEKLAQCPFLPVAEFVVRNSESDDIGSLALSPVFLETGRETLDEIKEIGQIILGLEQKDIISLDFECALDGTDENLFFQSDAYHLLEKTVEEGKGEENFIFDHAAIEFGSVCLTAVGDLVVDQLDFL